MRTLCAVLLIAAGLLFGALVGPVAQGSHPVIHPFFPTKISHVVVIVFENTEASKALSKGPFFAYLASHYAYTSNDYAVCHPSAPNYLALTSGATFSQCGTDSHFVYSATNIADKLEAKKLSWDAFAESMPSTCDVSNSYPYAVKHEPFLFYQDIVNNATRCKAHVLPLTSWTADVNASTIPNYSFITPNLKNDGHDTNVTFASNWLHGFLTPLVNTSWFASTAFFIVFDEGTTNLGAGTSSAGPTNTSGGGHIDLTIVSPNSLGVGSLTNLTSHYSVMTTIEWLLGLAATGHHDKTSLWPAIKSAFL